ncbi:MAG: hypothetical protein ACP5NX_03890 [Candidatus Bilamarchaeaceae archaeon]
METKEALFAAVLSSAVVIMAAIFGNFGTAMKDAPLLLGGVAIGMVVAANAGMRTRYAVLAIVAGALCIALARQMPVLVLSPAGMFAISMALPTVFTSIRRRYIVKN